MKMVVGFAAALMATQAFAEAYLLEPLGEPGTLQVQKELPVKPKLLDAPPVRPEALVLVDEKTTCAVVSDFKAPKSTGSHERKRLAEEVQWHLSEMCGREIPLLPEPPTNGAPYVEIALLDVPSQTSVVKVDGRRVLVGGDGPGISHAATYFLECLGCRYLWPGPGGKVIPKRKRIAMPAVDLEKTPEFDCIRRIWMPNCLDGMATNTVFPYLKLDARDYVKRKAEAIKDRPGNRSWGFWHGFSDVVVCRTGSKPSNYGIYSPGGHYFYGYYKKYWAEHPDWFALQPHGTREQKYDRPRICLSNEGLIQEVIKDRIAYCKANPQLHIIALCLPDAGHCSVCMCEGCRRLDPVNAPKIKFAYYTPGVVYTNYVSLTDRVITFWNKVAEGVLKECPGKVFKVNAYDNYSHPPVKVKPHPSLVFFNCVGSVTSEAGVALAGESVAAFAGLGSIQVWRPNILWGWCAQVPQNYSRPIYDLTALFKVNGIRGISMDCCSEEWALRGFVFYMVGRSLFNFDNLSYEGQLADYCAAFGKGAPAIRRYLGALEREYFRTRSEGRGYAGLLDGYPIDELAGILDEADRLTAAEPEDNARVAFLKKGLEVGREQVKMFEGWNTGKWKPMEEARKKYLAFLHDFIPENPVALCPHAMGYAGAYLRGAPRRIPQTPKKTEKARSADVSANFLEVLSVTNAVEGAGKNEKGGKK